MAVKIEDILKPGKKLTARSLSKKEVAKCLKRLAKIQRELQYYRKMDYEQLKNIYINI